MAKQNKKIHLIILTCGYGCHPVCSRYEQVVEPIEAKIKDRPRDYLSKGTFDHTKVTCKRCIKHPCYKEAQEKAKYPLFHWKENI